MKIRAKRQCSVTNDESGQAIVEFILLFFLSMIILFTFLQIVFIGGEKSKFDHVSAYTARAWAVQVDRQPEAVLDDVLWGMADKAVVDPRYAMGSDEATDAMLQNMTVQSVPINAKMEEVEFLKFEYDVPLTMPFAREFLGNVNKTGGMYSIHLTTLIPVEQEPREDSQKFDNDS